MSSGAFSTRISLLSSTLLLLVVLPSICSSQRLLELSLSSLSPDVSSMRVCMRRDTGGRDCALGVAEEAGEELRAAAAAPVLRAEYRGRVPEASERHVNSTVVVISARLASGEEKTVERHSTFVVENDIVETGELEGLFHFSYRLQCADHYYGRLCTYCRRYRDAHFECGSNGEKICHPKWAMPNCDRPFCPECTNGVCNKRGTCLCNRGWTGPNCDQCRPSEGCQHGGCRNNTPGTCACDAGWGGTKCDLDLTFCALRNPCVAGKCVLHNSARFECVCERGWHGEFCDVQKVELTGERACQHPALCSNGGTCEPLNLPGALFRCHCAPGFAGKNCEKAVCQPGLCLNGGDCFVDRQSKHHCTCAPGYGGQRCEVLHVIGVLAAGDSSPALSSAAAASASPLDAPFLMTLLPLLVVLAFLVVTLALLLRRALPASRAPLASSSSSSSSASPRALENALNEDVEAGHEGRRKPSSSSSDDENGMEKLRFSRHGSLRYPGAPPPYHAVVTTAAGGAGGANESPAAFSVSAACCSSSSAESSTLYEKIASP